MSAASRSCADARAAPSQVPGRASTAFDETIEHPLTPADSDALPQVDRETVDDWLLSADQLVVGELTAESPSRRSV